MARTGDNVHLSYSFPGFLLEGVHNSNVTRKLLQLHCFS